MANAATTAAKKVSRKTTNGSALVDPDLKVEVQEQIDALRGDIADLTRSVSLLAKDTSQRAHAMAEDAADEGKKRLESATEHARERASLAGDDAYAAGRKAAAELQGNVAQNPFAALAIAAGIGFLAGAFAKR